MAVVSELFAASRDWLSHTLTNANKTVTEHQVQLPDGTLVVRKATGVVYLQPPAKRANPNGEALIVSAGIHGNETAPIEVLNQLLKELLNGDWSLACPALLILGNPPAMVAGRRFIEVNLNRLFNGAHQKTEYQGVAEAYHARQLEEVCQWFAARHPEKLSHYDLHTAIRPSLREKFALYPYADGRQPPGAQCDFLLEADVQTLLLQHREGTTFSSFSASVLGAESFTVELGKVRPFGKNDLDRFTWIATALQRRMMGELAPDRPAESLTIFEVVHEIINTGESFHFHIPDDVANFTEYPPGTVIWEDDQTVYRVGEIPEAIVFPNPDVPVGQRVGLMVRQERSRAQQPGI